MTTTQVTRRHCASLVGRWALLCALVFAPITVHAQGNGGTPVGMPPLGTPRPLELPSVTQRTLPNGLKLVLLEDHRQPALWMRLAVPAGSLRDPRDRVGLAEMTAGLLDKGTTNHSESQIADTIDGLGASLDATAGRDFLIVSAQGLSSYSDTLLSLLADISLHPTFPQEELDRLRTRTLNEVTSALSQPAELAAAALNRVIYGAYPYGDFSTGLPATLSSIKREDVQRFHDTYFVPTGSTLFLVGDITPAQAETKVTGVFGAWTGDAATPPHAAPTPVATSSERPQITLIDRPGSEQTQIRIGVPTTGYRDPQRIVGQVATAILGEVSEFENRLTKEIRVKRGLTYDVGSAFVRREQAGAFEISTFTKNASTGEVVKLALDEANKMAQQNVGDEELSSHKTYLNGSFALEVATPDGVMARLEAAVLYGDGPADLTAYTDRVTSVTADQIRTLMQGLGLEHAHIVLVGDAKAIGDQIKPMGDVTVIPADAVDLRSPDLRHASTHPARKGSDPAAQTRLASVIQAYGGNAFLNLKSLQVKGKGELTPPGSQTPTAVPVEALTITVSAPDKSRVDLTTGFGEVTLGFPGADAVPWLRLAGSVHDAPRSVAMLATFVNPTRMLRDAVNKGYAVTTLPDLVEAASEASPRGSALVGFAVTDDAGHTTRVYVSRDTNLVRRMSIPGGANDVVVTLGNYHSTDGIEIPGAVRVDRGKTMIVNFTFDSFAVNPAVDSMLFARP